jgi:hypothetical protein
MRRSVGSTIDPVVFWISLVISILFVLWGVLFTESLSAVAPQQTSSLERESGG